MRLVACKACKAQYDVTSYPRDHFVCRCGERNDIPAARPVHAPIHHCSSCGASMDPEAGQCAYCGAFVERDHRKRNLMCPGCFTANPPSARFCSGCGSEFRPEKLREETTGRVCPDCGVELLHRSLVGQSISECAHCGGTWVDRDAFEALIEHAAVRSEEFNRQYQALRSNARRPPLVRKEGAPGFRYRKCPRCSQLMNRKRFKRISDVVLDRCVVHGVWLDEDELARVARFIASGGLARAELHESEGSSGEGPDVVIVESHEIQSGEIPEELLGELGVEDFDMDPNGGGVETIAQEIVIEDADGRVVKRRTTRRRGGDAKLKGLLSRFFDESFED